MSHRSTILKAYKSLLKESSKLTNYNFREYALIKVKSEFREHQFEKDPVRLKNLESAVHKNLEMLRRQAIVSQLYPAQQTVLEQKATTN